MSTEVQVVALHRNQRCLQNLDNPCLLISSMCLEIWLSRMSLMGHWELLDCRLEPHVTRTTQQKDKAKSRLTVPLCSPPQQQILQAAMPHYSQHQLRQNSNITPYQVNITSCHTMGAAQRLT